MTSPKPLLEGFRAVEGPRCTHLVEHPLLDIIGLTILASLCGANTWSEIEEYGQVTEAWLRSVLELSHGIPSADTLARVFARLDPEALQAEFQQGI